MVFHDPDGEPIPAQFTFVDYTDDMFHAWRARLAVNDRVILDLDFTLSPYQTGPINIEVRRAPR